MEASRMKHMNLLLLLLQKQDESLNNSNCGEAEQTASTPTTVNYSPEEIQSDPNLVPVTSLQATGDDKHRAEVSAAEDQLLNFDIFYDPLLVLLDDKLVSPVHAHFPPEFYHQANNELFQYGENNGPCSVSHVEMANMTHLQASHAYPEGLLCKIGMLDCFRIIPK
ncbi:unnamed protein product [Vicia faba]|uniref:Uncharacterized protein n=1 Tax=Vicia faba TaxID=3906 RepID=A0AAV1AEZ9_VICFA|nr:unnamed protein product [Vicia faba]